VTVVCRGASSEVLTGAFATLWDFDVIYFFIIKNFLNQTIKILQNKNTFFAVPTVLT
jgi:hypothetical protein